MARIDPVVTKGGLELKVREIIDALNNRLTIAENFSPEGVLGEVLTSQGSIAQPAYSSVISGINDINDVIVTDPQNGDLLVYEDGQWYNRVGLDNVFNVKDFGATGYGNDTAAIQDTAAAAAVKGGTIWLPSNEGEIYGISSTIDVCSLYPIHFRSAMQVSRHDTYAGSYIKPLAELPDGIFKYQTPAGSARSEAGGGSVVGLAFADPLDRHWEIGSALNLVDFNLSTIRDCQFMHLDGSAIITDFVVQSNLTRLNIGYCGNDGNGVPAVVLGVSAFPYITQSTIMSDCRLEVNYGTYVHIEDESATNQIINCNFEAGGTSASWFTYILNKGDNIKVASCNFNRNEGATHVHFHSDGGRGILADCSFQGDRTSADPTILIESYRNVLDSLLLWGAASQTGTQISITGIINTMSNVLMNRGGNLDISGSLFSGSNICIYNLDTTESHAVKVANSSLITGLKIDETGSGVEAVEFTGQSQVTGSYRNVDGASDGTVHSLDNKASSLHNLIDMDGTPASVTLTGYDGEIQQVSVTSGVAFQINNPSGAQEGSKLTLVISNDIGGVMGVITWGSAYKLAGSFTNPTDGTQRTISFYYDGTNWIESARANADIS